MNDIYHQEVETVRDWEKLEKLLTVRVVEKINKAVNRLDPRYLKADRRLRKYVHRRKIQQKNVHENELEKPFRMFCKESNKFIGKTKMLSRSKAFDANRLFDYNGLPFQWIQHGY